MTTQLPGYRTSSAHRPRGGSTLLSAVAVALLVLVVGLALRQRAREPIARATPAPSRATPSMAAAATATASATPTAALPVEFSSDWVVAEVVIPTPTPWPTLPPPPPTARREPSPTPRPGSCVSFRWTSSQVFVPSAQVLVEINAVNRCNRDLGPLDLWFEISGWRDGALVQSVRGHPFERVRRGGSGIVAIGLPGSADWYDEIRVVILD